MRKRRTASPSQECAASTRRETRSTRWGSGDLDFSAYEKVTLGWIRDQPHVTAPKRYVLAPPTTESTLAQSLIVDTEQGSWWIEYRSQPFRGLLFRSSTIASFHRPSRNRRC
jgi:hypothetical protein